MYSFKCKKNTILARVSIQEGAPKPEHFFLVTFFVITFLKIKLFNGNFLWLFQAILQLFAMKIRSITQFLGSNVVSTINAIFGNKGAQII